MKSLAELNDLLTDLPSPFAATLPDMDFPPEADASGEPAVNYETGIPQEYAGGSDDSSEEGGSLMPRADFNRIGNLATRELFFRRCGGLHTFDDDFSARNIGYTAGSLLNYDDGKVLKTVESQEDDNDLSFVDHPAVIDAKTRKPSDASDAQARILWKSVGFVNCTGEGVAHVGVDYSRRQDIASGETLNEDSLVLLGSNAWEKGVWGTDAEMESAAWEAALWTAVSTGQDVQYWVQYYLDYFTALRSNSTCGEFKVAVSVDDEDMDFVCKGMQGGSFGFDDVANLSEGLSTQFNQTVRVYYNRFMGGASFPLAFFARKGTKISYSAFGKNWDKWNEIAGSVTCIAYPLETSVRSASAEGGAA